MGILIQYWFWLAAVSLFCFALERLAPWRKQQRVFRRQFGQDLLWLVFNGHFLGLSLAKVTGSLVLWINARFDSLAWPAPDSLMWIHERPLWAQFLIFLVFKDLVEWCIHNLLHRVPWLWEFHKLHHSILELDWIGNFRFHWVEVVVYKSLTYFPLVVLGVDGRVILWVAIVGTLIGHLNHSNLAISWGPLRYLINSPRMHVWHHDLIARGAHGKNFGIVLSVWDWVFRTAYMPREGQPERLGFDGIEQFPRGIVGRMLYPVSRWFVN